MSIAVLKLSAIFPDISARASITICTASRMSEKDIVAACCMAVHAYNKMFSNDLKSVEIWRLTHKCANGKQREEIARDPEDS